MLKFFRQYNKWFLAVGGTLLMIAFLLPMSTFTPQQGDATIGTIGGENVMLSDRVQAANQLDLLQMFPLLRVMLPLEQRDEATQYLLMQREAELMGISASEAEVNQVLLDLQVGPREIAQMLQRTRATEGMIRETVRRWIVVQNYLPLVQGRAYTPLQTRMQMTMFAYQMLQVDPMQAMQVLPLTQGSPRLSEPLLTHFIASQRAMLAGEVVLVGHERYLDQVGDPTDEQLRELFERHRDSLPGESEDDPYGFGYRTPPRVKIEWVQVPAEAVRATVAIDEADAIDYFEQNRSRYADPDAGEADTTYSQARDRVMSDLRRQQADQQAAQAAKVAQVAMQEDPAARGLTRGAQYAEVPADFEPISLDAVAQRVAERTGITPVVQRFTDGWVPTSALTDLPGIGLSQLAGRTGISFSDYVASARELEPAADNPLTPLRLQRGLPSEPLRAFDGSYFVFRLVDVQPSRAPGSLDEVRAEVADDWRRLRAFERLESELPQLVQAARERGLETLNSELDAPMLGVGPVSRREQSMMGMGLVTPTLPGIGQSDALLDAMFATAEEAVGAEGATTGSLAELDSPTRIGGAPVAERLSVAVYRVDSYEPITRDSYEQNAGSPFIGASVDRVLLRDSLDENPFSVRAIARRIGYAGEGLEDEAGQDAAAGATASAS